MEGTPTLEELTRKLAEMAQRHQQFQQEIIDLRTQIHELKNKDVARSSSPTQQNASTDKPLPTVTVTAGKESVSPKPEVEIPAPAIIVKPKKKRTPTEEFIGTNLLNKIGIAVLVIGIGIGAEYAIDHDLISPLTRIVLGYFLGVVLIVLAIRLKPKYKNFSAVLLSGGMAVLYFITFAAYDLYELIPQILAFILMVLFTAFTVFAALQYDLRAVAIIGLVGAYAVPFLLSDGSGRVVVLYSYMTVINIGILVLAFKKHWKQLYYIAFSLTWLIYMAWYMDQYRANDHLWTALIFSTIFFLTFYITLLAYKLIRHEPLARWDIVLLLLNSFMYYGFGYDAIESRENGELFLGLFTVFNAVMHFAASVVIFKRHEASRDTFFFAAGLVLLFLTLAVPVQLEGNWVTIIWAGESALLFWIGRTRNFPAYEKLSYPLILLALGSLVQDWDRFYGHYSKDLPETFVRLFLNVQFLTSLLTCAAFGWILKVSRDQQYPSPLKQGSIGNNLLLGGIPALLLLCLFVSIFVEIGNFWDQRFTASEISVQQGGENSIHSDYDTMQFKDLWLFNYSAVFVFILSLINLRWLKHQVLNFIIVAFSAIILFSFITTGLNELRFLLSSYIHQVDAEYYYRGKGYILFRYLSIAFMVPLLWVNYTITRAGGFQDGFQKAERIFFHVVMIALLSSELVSILALLDINDSDKLTLSLLWGAYALYLIVFGLIKDHKYIRITAITLFGITLLKLFFYDISDMGTIAKTIVMIILGGLLLVASFLYNKFKKPSNVQPENK